MSHLGLEFYQNKDLIYRTFLWKLPEIFLSKYFSENIWGTDLINLASLYMLPIERPDFLETS